MEMLKSKSWKPAEITPKSNWESWESFSFKNTGFKIMRTENWISGKQGKNQRLQIELLGRRKCTRKKTSLQLRGSSAGHELPAHGLPWELTYSTRQLQTLLELMSQVFVQFQRRSGRSCSNCWTEKRFKSVCSIVDWQGGMDGLWKTCKERDYFQQQRALKSDRIKNFPRSHWLWAKPERVWKRWIFDWTLVWMLVKADTKGRGPSSAEAREGCGRCQNPAFAVSTDIFVVFSLLDVFNSLFSQIRVMLFISWTTAVLARSICSTCKAMFWCHGRDLQTFTLKNRFWSPLLTALTWHYSV